MSAPALSKKVRPLTLTAALGLVLLVMWRTDIWGSDPSQTDRAGKPTSANAEAGLTMYPRGERPGAPVLEGTTLDDETFQLSDLTGHIVVINVWGSWCGPCRAETPDLVRIARQHENRGVRFVGIDTRDNLAAAKAFVDRFNVPYPSVFDENGAALLPFVHLIPNAAVPSTIVVDADGKVAAKVVGRVTYNTLNGLLDDLEAETL